MNFTLGAQPLAQSFMTLSNGALLQVDSSANGQGASLWVGSNGGQATLDVQSGSQVTVLGASGNFGSTLNIGNGAGSVGTVTVTGPGSSLALIGSHTNAQVGGNGGSGALNLQNGASMTAGGLDIGNQAIGTVTLAGGSGLHLNGSDGRLLVGNRAGTGSLTVSGGSVVDATLNAAACVGNWCGNGVANNAGSTGALTITGAGSEVRTLRSFWAGDTWVDQFSGTPGGTSHATINILDGGSLRTEGAFLGTGASGPLNNGSEKSFTDVLIDGPGSQWIVTRNSVDNGTASMNIAGSANSTATVTVSNGGKLRIDGASSPGPFDGINVGSLGTGTLTVTGAGSRVETTGADRYIGVGTGNLTGKASLHVLAGGVVDSMYMNVGRNGSSGTLVVDGAGSRLDLSGVGVDFANTTGDGTPAFLSIGRTGGKGNATVSNGGSILITDGGFDSRTSGGSPGIIVGNESGSVGALAINGAGSKAQIVSSTINPASGAADNYNPYMSVGRRDATTTGQLTIGNGGVLQLTGNALSTPTFSRGTNFYVGGDSDTLPGGKGTVSVSGPGSALRVEGVDAFVAVGMNGTGTLSLTDQALLSTMIINVGRAPSGAGTLLVDNGQITLSGQQTGNNLSGAAMSIGNRGGNGSAAITNGSVVTITNMGSSGASLNLGGTSPNPLGSGNLTLSGGSKIVLTTAPGLATFSVGRDGSGIANIGGASQIDIGDGATFVGRLAGGVGTVALDGGSQLLAGLINIGGGSDSVAGGVGTVSVSGLGSLLSAKQGPTQFIAVGRQAGNGTLSVSDQAKVVGTLMAVGRGAGGVGTLNIDHAAVELSGQHATFGNGLAIGQFGGTGAVNLTHGGSLTLTNPGGTLGVDLRVGGSITGPLGTGSLNASGGSQVKLIANAGPATATIGHDGTGTATFSGGSTLDAGGGQVIIAGQPGSTGTLTLDSGSKLYADYVGVGSLPGGIDGGNGSLFVKNSSEVFATTVEIGKNGLLGGDLGTINAHDLIVRGTLSPGNSPGRLKVNGLVGADGPGRLKVDGPGRLKIDVGVNADGSYSYDELILTEGTAYDLETLNVEFNFIGNTNPDAFAATGKLDLDTFIRSADSSGNESGLSSTFASGTTWNDVLSHARFTATSNDYLVDISPDLTGSGALGVVVRAVPEPGTWLFWLGGGAALVAMRRRGRRAYTRW